MTNAAAGVAPMDPLEVVDRFGAAWAAHDLERTLVLVTADCVVRRAPAPLLTGSATSATTPSAGHGKPSSTMPTAVFEAEETFAAGDRVVQRWRYTWDDRDGSREVAMTRKIADCREMPSESGCTLTIAGEEEEVVRAAAMHAADVHGHPDGPELRDQIRSMLTVE